MSNFLIFKAAFNNSATPAIGTYTAEGATAQFNRNTSISPDYYLYNTAQNSAVQWFVPTKETTDFEFVADILTRNWSNNVTYFIIADSTGTTRLRMWSVYTNWYFENSDSTSTTGSPEYIGVINPATSGGFGVFHQFRVRVRKLTASSSSVEVYVDGTLKLTATAGAALITCAKIGFVGGVGTFGPGAGAGIKNAYVYDLSGGDVIDRGVLSGAFNRFISWMKSKFALKSDIPTVNDATLTIQQNGVNVQTFTANQATAATANIQCVDLTNDQTVGGNKEFTGTTTAHDVIPSATETYNFGSSTAQWNNAYIKSLTIDGVACGDILTHNASEFVNVSSNQTIGGIKTFSNIIYGLGSQIILRRNDVERTVLPASFVYTAFSFNDKSGVGTTSRFSAVENVVKTNGDINLDLRAYDFSTKSNAHTTVVLERKYDGTSSFHPEQNNTVNLGTSTNKWKSFNGVNPGALSLPNITGLINVASSITILDGSEVNTFTPQVNGWLLINGTGVANDAYIYVVQGRIGMMSSSNASMNRCAVLIPVVAGVEVSITCKLSTLTWANLVPCQGNV